MLNHKAWNRGLPQAAYLTHALETARQRLEADIAFAAVREEGKWLPTPLTQHTGLAPDLVRIMDLHHWTADPGSVLDYLAGPAPTNRALRPIEAVGASAVARSALFRRIERYRAVSDALGVALTINNRKLIYVFIRWANRARFTPSDENKLNLALEQLNIWNTESDKVNGHEPQTAPATETCAQMLERLSRTERLVLNHLTESLTEKQIAEELDRSPHTVHVHIKSIYLKLGVSSRREPLKRIAPLAQAS
ncbi:helix-turn-helix transcriptional regulator [Mucisphaera sp.]|uniref:helix-turn-helix transcriptional regulator n=1 Tax=Mucisphaera sp. TaxID=2913024 RepID=UPI003D1407C7